MPKMAFDSQGCKGITSGASGKHYQSDRQGFFNVDDSDVRHFKAGGCTLVSGMPRVRVFYTCDACSRDSFLNHCSKCDSHNLRRVEK